MAHYRFNMCCSVFVNRCQFFLCFVYWCVWCLKSVFFKSLMSSLPFVWTVSNKIPGEILNICPVMPYLLWHDKSLLSKYASIFPENPKSITFLISCNLTLPPCVAILQHIAIRLPDSLPIFELLVLVTDEFPQLCVGVRDCSNGKHPYSQQLKFDIIELNSTPISVPGRMDCCVSPLRFCRAQLKAYTKLSALSLCVSADSGALRAAQVTQLDRDTVLIALEGKSFPSQHVPKPPAIFLTDS